MCDWRPLMFLMAGMFLYGPGMRLIIVDAPFRDRLWEKWVFYAMGGLQLAASAAFLLGYFGVMFWGW